MFDGFQKTYSGFKKKGVENPLIETLKIFDILSIRALSKVDKKIIMESDLNIEELFAERKKGIPTEYILGLAPFMGKLFHCSPAALIPREETELLTKISIDLLMRRWREKKQITVIDMGTGCGNIAVSIALNVKNAKVIASDLSDEHINIARKNVEKFKLQNRVSLFCGDLFEAIECEGFENSIEMIVCNPPYIPTASLVKLNPEIKNNEPKTAFDGGAFGIDIYRRLVNDSTRFLEKNGILVFEIGVGQEKLVNRLINKNKNFGDIEFFSDGEQTRVIKCVYQGMH